MCFHLYKSRNKKKDGPNAGSSHTGWGLGKGL
uniref:Uncharacterized protein n=1 Tax=Arundo donax TaxID=35708 RepID=A0A0A9CF80_ARUDO